MDGAYRDKEEESHRDVVTGHGVGHGTICNSSTQDPETGRLLQVRGQSGLHRECQTNQSHKTRHNLKTKTNTINNKKKGTM